MSGLSVQQAGSNERSDEKMVDALWLLLANTVAFVVRPQVGTIIAVLVPCLVILNFLRLRTCVYRGSKEFAGSYSSSAFSWEAVKDLAALVVQTPSYFVPLQSWME